MCYNEVRRVADHAKRETVRFAQILQMQEIHPPTNESKQMKTLNTPIVNAVAALTNVVLFNAAEQRVLYVAWPDDAEFCVMTKSSTWPIGWDSDPTVRFFTSRTAFDRYVADATSWARCEDNDFALKAFEWNWGPQHLPEFDRNLDRLPQEDQIVANVSAPDVPNHQPLPATLFLGMPEDDELIEF